MKNKIFILFDCPDETNDKKWLLEELSKLHGGNVYSVSITRKLHRMLVGNLFEKIHSNLIILWQCIRALKLGSRKKDVFITWNRRTGLFLNAILVLLHRKNKLITMNWLTPKPNESTIKLIQKVFKNPYAQIIVNSPESEIEWNFQMKRQRSNITVIPDVYDSGTTFVKREKKDDYCFTGGYNNRNWNVIKELAFKHPSISFVCVANKNDFESVVKEDIPSNMKVLFDIEAAHYYDLMRDAYIVLLPLRDKRVAGLINIVKSASFGVPCMITKTVSTAQYYASGSTLLVDEKVNQSWSGAFEKILKMNECDYQKMCSEYANFVKNNFAPQNAAKKIYEITVH